MKEARNTIVITLLFILQVLPVSFMNLVGQDLDEFKDLLLEADSYFIFEEYQEALPNYLKVYRQMEPYPNLQYKIGKCYLNIVYQKSQSIAYLGKAVEGISKEYNYNSWKEMAAPPEALYELGNAYRVNYKLEKAIEAYKEFTRIADKNTYDFQLLNDQVESCKYALKQIGNPVFFEPTNLGEKINSRFTDRNAVMSGNGEVLAYTTELQFYDALFISRKINGEWQYPVNMMPELQIDGDAYPTCLSYDGTELYIYRNDDYVGNLYVTQFSEGKWSPLKKLNICTKYWESHAAISKDKQTLYFTSNRPGGHGDLDIYYAKRKSAAEWGDPVNIGPTINTRYNEETPFITTDGSKLYYSSYGHQNMGGYDIFYAKRRDPRSEAWTEPVNLGYPLNTPDDNFFFQPVNNGIFGLVSWYHDEKTLGYKDIYLVEIFSKLNPRRFQIEGIVNLPDSLANYSNLRIKLIDKSTNDTLQTIITDSLGNFILNAYEGDYEVLIEGDKYISGSYDISFKPDQPGSRTQLEHHVQVDSSKLAITEELIADNIHLKDTLIKLGQGEKEVKIKLLFEKEGELLVEAINDSGVVVTETFQIDKKRFTYKHEPGLGNTIIKFKLATPDSTVSYRQVTVTRLPETMDVTPVIQQDDEPLPNSISSLLDKLMDVSVDQNIRIALEDAKKKRIVSSTMEISRYLEENKEKYAYSKDDINQLYNELAEIVEAKQLLELLYENAENGFKVYIGELQEKKPVLKDTWDINDQIFNDATGENKLDDQYLETLQKILFKLDTGQEDIMSFMLKTSQNLSLKYTIDSLVKDKQTNGLQTYLDKLIDLAGENDYSRKDIAIALSERVVKDNLPYLYQSMAKDFALEKDPVLIAEIPDSINNISGLLNYLRKKLELQGISDDLVNQMIINYYQQEQHQLNNFIQELEILANKKDTVIMMEYYHLAHDTIQNIEGAVRLLSEIYTREKGSFDELIKIMGEVAFQGDIKDYSMLTGKDSSLNYLYPDSSALDQFTNMTDYLKHLATRSFKNASLGQVFTDQLGHLTGVKISREFTRELIDSSSADLRLKLMTSGSTSFKLEDLDSLLISLYHDNDTSSMKELARLSVSIVNIPPDHRIKMLEELASVDLKNKIKILVQKDPSITIEKLSSKLVPSLKKDQLTEWAKLYSNYIKHGVTSGFITGLLAKASDSLSVEITGLISGEQLFIQPEEFIRELYKKLEGNELLKKEFANLLIDYISETDTRLFYDQLVKHASGKLREYLVSGSFPLDSFNAAQEIIQFLLDKAHEEGYTKEDLLKTLQRMIIARGITIPADQDLYKQDGQSKPACCPGCYKLIIGLLLIGILISLFLFLKEKRKKQEEQEDR